MHWLKKLLGLVPLTDAEMNRYKSYPIGHFTEWRAHANLAISQYMVGPYVLLRYRPKIVGRENVPRRGVFITVANHISLLDPPLVSLATQRPLAFMAKKELFKNRLAAEFYRLVGTFALDREKLDSASLKSAFNLLRSSGGHWGLGLFPEGTRSTSGHVLPLKKGFSTLAAKTNVPVLPIGISMAPDHTWRVRVGKLITDVSDADAVHEQVQRELERLTQT